MMMNGIYENVTELVMISVLAIHCLTAFIGLFLFNLRYPVSDDSDDLMVYLIKTDCVFKAQIFMLAAFVIGIVPIIYLCVSDFDIGVFLFVVLFNFFLVSMESLFFVFIESRMRTRSEIRRIYKCDNKSESDFEKDNAFLFYYTVFMDKNMYDKYVVEDGEK